MADTEESKKQFAREMSAWLDELAPDAHDWAEALVAAALDETRGDLTQALALAKREYAADPNPPG